MPKYFDTSGRKDHTAEHCHGRSAEHHLQAADSATSGQEALLSYMSAIAHCLIDIEHDLMAIRVAVKG